MDVESFIKTSAVVFSLLASLTLVVEVLPAIDISSLKKDRTHLRRMRGRVFLRILVALVLSLSIGLLSGLYNSG